MSTPLLQLIDVHRTYQIGESTVQALRGVSVTIERGDFVAIMGASGSGKSSLMLLRHGGIMLLDVLVEIIAKLGILIPCRAFLSMNFRIYFSLSRQPR